MSLTEIEPEEIPFLTFSKIKIIESLFCGISTSMGSLISLVKRFFCSLSKADPYSYLLRGREIFVNCVSTSFFIFDF